MRHTTCKGCGRLFVVASKRGPLPARCPTCKGGASPPAPEPEDAYATSKRGRLPARYPTCKGGASPPAPEPEDAYAARGAELRRTARAVARTMHGRTDVYGVTGARDVMSWGLIERKRWGPALPPLGEPS